jgi:ubiquinone/menaquinone biosynthesis C-methylase UbiE
MNDKLPLTMNDKLVRNHALFCINRHGKASSIIFIGTVVLVFLIRHFSVSTNVLTGMENRLYTKSEMHLVSVGFCLSSLVDKIERMAQDEHHEIGVNTTFAQTGDVPEDEYEQSSIYAMLYSLYRNALPEWYGKQYQFTFNTWGFSPSNYPISDPERFGKQAYAALVTQAPVLDYMKKHQQEKLEFVEVGCGTGAGANLITSEVHTNIHYLALDMQGAAINTCKDRHAKEGTLDCEWIPKGVGRDGSRIPKADSSVDVVVISETHIAERVIGDLEKAIFKEIRRVLKPGGIFVWGNALTTSVWKDAMNYLTEQQWTLLSNTNYTAGAIRARNEDYDRVEKALDGILDSVVGMELPFFGARCRRVTKQLIANFYRHPGTAMYLKMVVGEDSYMHQAWTPNK